MTESKDPSNRNLGEVGEFTLVSKIADGGMGTVYLARQERLGRDVAVKILPREMISEGVDSIARFQQEILTLANLTHPNIVSVLDRGETEEGDPWYAMEYVEGATLYERIREGNLSTKHVYQWIPQICDALEFAHNNGVVHRDIKPTNILITPTDQIKIVDFGLAKHVDGEQTASFLKTQQGVSLGTPDFISPEQMDGTVPVDGRADIYSLGVLLYNLLTDSLPKGGWKPPSKVIAGLPREFDEIVDKAVQQNPEERWSDVGEFRDALLAVPQKAEAREKKKHTRPVLVTGPVATVRKSTTSHPRGKATTGKPATTGRGKKSDKSVLIAGVAVVLLLAGIGGATAYFSGNGEAEPEGDALALMEPTPVETVVEPELEKAAPPVENPPSPAEPEPAPEPSESVAAAPDEESIDLLEHVDTSINPNWKMEGGKLFSPDCGGPDSGLPNATNAKGIVIPRELPEQYTLTMRVKPDPERNLGSILYLPTGKGRRFRVAVDISGEKTWGWKGKGTCLMPGKTNAGDPGIPSFVSGREWILPPGEETELRFLVHPEQFRLEANGRTVLDAKAADFPDGFVRVTKWSPGNVLGELDGNLGIYTQSQWKFPEITVTPYEDTPAPPPFELSEEEETPEAQPEISESTETDTLTGPVNLLKHVDLSLNPNWNMEEGKLVSPECTYAKASPLPRPEEVKGIVIPYSFPESYHLRVKANKLVQGNQSGRFLLPVGRDKKVFLYLDGAGDGPRKGTAFSPIGEEMFKTDDPKNPTFFSETRLFKRMGEPTTLFFSVQPHAIRMEADGRTVIAWETEPDDDTLGGPGSTWTNIEGKLLSKLGLFMHSAFVFEEITVLPFDKNRPPAPPYDPAEAKAEAAAAVKLTGPVDLLEHVDLSLNPNWKMEDGKLISPDSGRNVEGLPTPEQVKGIMLPFDLPASYEIRADITPLTHRNPTIRFFLPIGPDRRTILYTDRNMPEWKETRTTIYLEGSQEADSGVESPFSEGKIFGGNGSTVSLKIRVTPNTFRFEVDGRRNLEWEQADGGPRLGNPSSGSSSIFDGDLSGRLGILGYSSVAIEKLTVHPVGTPSEKPPAPEPTPSEPAPAKPIIQQNPADLLLSDEENPHPEPVAKALAPLADSFSKAWQDRVVKVHENATAKLDQSYLRALNQAQTKAAKEDVDLAAAQAIRAERNGIRDGALTVPDKDPPGTPPALAALRDTYRTQTLKNRQQRKSMENRLLGQLDKQLDAIQNRFTQEVKIDEALAIKALRTRFAELKAGNSPKPAAQQKNPTPSQPPSPAEPSAESESGLPALPPGGDLVVLNWDTGQPVDTGHGLLPKDRKNISFIDYYFDNSGGVIRSDGTFQPMGSKANPVNQQLPAQLAGVVASASGTDLRVTLFKDGTAKYWGDWGDGSYPEGLHDIRSIQWSGKGVIQTITTNGEVQFYPTSRSNTLRREAMALKRVREMTPAYESAVALLENGKVEILDPEETGYSDADHDAAKKIEDGLKLGIGSNFSPEVLVLTKSGSLIPLGWGPDFTLPELPNDLVDVALATRGRGETKPIGAALSKSRGWIFFGHDLKPEIAARLGENSAGCDRLYIHAGHVFGIRIP